MFAAVLSEDEDDAGVVWDETIAGTFSSAACPGVPAAPLTLCCCPQNIHHRTAPQSASTFNPTYVRVPPVYPAQIPARLIELTDRPLWLLWFRLPSFNSVTADE